MVVAVVVGWPFVGLLALPMAVLLSSVLLRQSNVLLHQGCIRVAGTVAASEQLLWCRRRQVGLLSKFGLVRLVQVTLAVTPTPPSLACLLNEYDCALEPARTH